MQIIESEKRSSGGINQVYGTIENFDFELMFNLKDNFRVCYLFDFEKKLIAFEDRKRNKFWSCKENAKEILKTIYDYYSLN